MKVDVIEQKNLSELKPSISQVQCHPNTNSGQFVIPWISRVFDNSIYYTIYNSLHYCS